MDENQQTDKPAEPLIKVDPTIRSQIGEGMATVMEQLPHLTAALDRAVADLAGKRLAIAIVVYTEGFAMHGSNLPKDASDAAIIGYAESLKNHGGSDGVSG